MWSCHSNVIASRSAGSKLHASRHPPHELFVATMSTPRCFSVSYQSMHSTTLAEVPLPVLSWDLHGIMVTCQFIPATPTPLLVTAPIVPARWVPWLKSSFG